VRFCSFWSLMRASSVEYLILVTWVIVNMLDALWMKTIYEVYWAIEKGSFPAARVVTRYTHSLDYY
ncbi:MAG: hypothetical protein AB2704_23445, partial [Candidatus Thiodiazotropha taylori]